MAFYELLVEWSGRAWPLIANHLWQATIFFLFVLAVSSLLKRAPARVHYSLWLAALAKFVLPSAAVAWLINQTGIDLNSLFTSSGSPSGVMPISPFLSPVASPPAVQYTVESLPPVIAPDVLTSVTTVQNHSYWYGLLTLIWAIGCALFLGLWLRKRRLLSVAIRSGRVMTSGREFEILERVRSWLGLRHKVKLVISPRISQPGVWRALKPIVVLPEGVPDRLDDNELEAIMMHELVHVERWDNLMSIPQRMVCCLLWFHPLVWLLDRQLVAEREQSCDDTVIRLSGESAVYASSIKKVCRHSLGWEMTGLANAAGSDLKKRIKRIAGTDINRSPSVLHRAILCVVAAALILLSAAAGIITQGEVATKSVNAAAGAIDSRFVVTTSEEDRAGDVATIKKSEAPPPLQRAQVIQEQTKQLSAAPVEIRVQSADKIESNEPGIINGGNQVNEDNSPLIFVKLPSPPAEIRSAIIPVAATRANLSEFVGRYEVDPTKAENFILDITLERGELWLKPSHASKRKLVLTSELNLTDVYSDFRFTALADKKGRVTGLRLDSWSTDIIARKLALPRPSLQGVITFRLRGHANARIVALAGSFNNWNQSQLLFAREGDEWVCRVNLKRGKHEYKFIIDGDWITDPNNPKIVSDDRGNQNSLLTTE